MNNWSTDHSKKRILLYSGVLSIILIFTLRIFDNPLHTSVSPKGIVSFELAKDIDSSLSILSSWDTNAKINAGLSLGIDFLFLFAYSIFLATACYLVAKKYIFRNPKIYKIGLTLAYLQLLAGLFDAIENIALVKLLLGSQNGLHSSIAYYFASTKFIIIALGILYIIIGYIISIFHKDIKMENNYE